MFQSTHPRGVRHAGKSWTMSSVMFQSTHPRGVRQGVGKKGADKILVSIHAPARGATDKDMEIMDRAISFNPRTREGCDAPPVPEPVVIEVSIHAPARGATTFLASGSIGKSGFNPRTREGCDKFEVGYIMMEFCFNPRTREGCDAGHGTYRHYFKKSPKTTNHRKKLDLNAYPEYKITRLHLKSQC